MINRLLVANRGEIACRIMRTCRELGIVTVAVHSDIDRDARHVREADMAVGLGGAKPADSYLRIDAIIEAARQSGCQAIHPGYGFLSENAEFARAIEAAGLILLGPPASAIDAMGSKSAAKALMQEAGVPLVPGYHGADQSLDSFRDEAARIGYPVLLKASAGGGGKGMKVVESEPELAEALASAQREARSSFGDERILVEKYLLKPRHIEIQVFADQHGGCIYLNERDCSIQRRHQKVVEEAPAPGLTPALRAAMGEAAVKAAQAIGYVGAGTVEFLLDERGDFFFMEMNTRLQVEHPVTEAITGLDLVAWQIRIAVGEPLRLSQSQVPLNGHAIEVRLYAEEPASGFLPSTGRLDLYREPAAGPGRRVDSGIEQSDEVSPFYDPMLAKLIAWGETREMARRRLLQMLGETVVGGLHTNLAFLTRIISHPAFAAAGLDTAFIPRHEAQLLPSPEPLPDAFWQAAADAWLATEPPIQRGDDMHSPWARLNGWRAGLSNAQPLHLSCAGERKRIVPCADHAAKVAAKYFRQGATLYFQWQHDWLAVRAVDPLAEVQASLAPQGSLTAPMNGNIVRVLVQAGDEVAAGAPLVVLEAMKMEHSIRAPAAGRVREVFYAEGAMVAEGAVLIDLHSAAEAQQRSET
ncbi:acetyl/propionyl/methylcrotonyl-CoA carboxylase subunit alpha [Pseudomonas sp. OIL-1]|uniref:acetyl/propionyl/methylcrotonyl-CoA carboxylase subunit alpha n=1 Tax=Pseudomonas sp. OIL-1 TaxID=2706126 RepID=UPI0013A792BE|nr:acetyl/propionyl/methylcrotonyl-CoA carboxylase subunit alpha [Pseudomonas sp. OIL-1]QIB53099.1 acetyl/propionyl/methylcrotonyl-CoA carboxylase subunit alpha [Pseudomonas sp. OIL-1]